MATAAPGTIPALTPYQPGALPITGQEILEIASSTNATTAASGFMFITDVVGKAPSVMPSATPLANDLVAFFQKATGSSFSTPIGNLAVPAGNIPVAGATGQILTKNSGTNFDTGWDSISQFVLVGTGLARSGSTAVTLSLGSTAGVSVLGVAAAASAVPAAIVAGGGNQFLVSNAGNTGLGFEALTTAFLPGPYQTGTLTAFGVIYGNGTSPLGATAAGTSLWPLLGNGPASAPSFQQINLGSASVTGLLPVANITGVFPAANLTAANLATSGPGGVQGLLPIANVTGVFGLVNGGIGTNAVASHAVVIGAGTAVLQVASPATAGGVFISQGSTTNPAFEVVGGDLVMSALGTATVTTNAITNAKLAQVAGQTLKGNNSSATANAADLTLVQALALLGVAPAPGGRLTITNGGPVLVTAASLQGTLYYAPYANSYVPINNGSGIAYYSFIANATSTTGLALVLGTSWAANAVFDAFAILNGTSPGLGTIAWSNWTTRATALGMFSGFQTNGTTATMQTGQATTTSVAANQGTWLGTFLTDATNSGVISWLPGATGTGSQQVGRLSIYNAYNWTEARALVADGTSSWTYNSTTARAANGNANNAVVVVSGATTNPIVVSYLSGGATNGVNGGEAFIGFGLDKTNNFDRFNVVQGQTTAGLTFSMNVSGEYLQAGAHTVQAMEATNANTASFNGGLNTTYTTALNMALDVRMLM